MTVDQAIQVLTVVCAQHQGTLEDHRHVQDALETIRSAVTADTEDTK